MKFHRIQFRSFVTSLLLVSLAGISGCASGPKQVDFSPDTNPQAKVTELRDRMKNDQAKQYDKLSPDNFQLAGKRLDDAQHQIDQSSPTEETLVNAGKAAARLQIVEANGAKSTDAVMPVLNARQFAINAHAPEMMSEDFASADKDFNGFGHDIENDNFHPETQDISKLEAKYSNIELKAVEKTTLGKAHEIITQAEKSDAKSKAPLTYAAAQTRYDTALRAIEADRRNPSAYKNAVDASTMSAQKLNAVLDTIGTSRTSENAAVKIYDQQQELVASRESLDQSQAHTRAAKNVAEAEHNTEATLQGQNDEYATKAANNAKIETVRAEFSPSEADVLRDGNKIILRLKMMKFSTDRFELTQSSIETLQKVKDMIAAVSFSQVLIEGHTDNVGTEKKNLVLSQNRAETVKKYLEAENSVSADKIQAHGYGYEKPLVSNKTAQGRAVNRRVDVIIDTNADL
jgi:OOP family OmpA-OmpF porin